MDFQFTDKEEAFRNEVREWLDRELTVEVLRDMEALSWTRVGDAAITPQLREFNKKMGAKGLLGMNWPKEYGGQSRSIVDQFIVVEEMSYHWAVIPNHYAVTMEGPCILNHGNEEQKRYFLPRICNGEIELALGYTEPQAGSDLASLEVRAVDEGDCYILNGQKVFNTSCHYADYHWLAARTDFNVPKHKGISMFIVDLKSPGITVRPLYTMAGGRTNEVFYDDVRVPKNNLIGEVNKGWAYLVEALDFERIMTFVPSNLQRLLDELIRYVKVTRYDGVLLAQNPIIRQKIAEIAVELEVARLLHYRTLMMLDRKLEPTYEGAMLKLVITELAQKLTNAGMQILGQFGLVQNDSRWLPLKGWVETGYRATIMYTFGAGSSELMRTIIATRGYGLPR